MPVLNDYFFNNRNIYISKHNRFAPYPTHSHQFLEINYLLAGQADEIVAGQSIHLNQGDLLLIDVGTPHSIARLNKNDLLINILFRDQNISIELLNQMQRTKSVLDNFLINHSAQQRTQQSFLLFNHENSEIQQTIEQIIEEYFFKPYFSDAVIQASLTILVALLARNYPIEPEQHVSTQHQLAINLLTEIRNHYADTSLEKLATKYAYNKNYLGSLFHKEIGTTFSNALTSERLLQAQNLIKTTAQPLNNICRTVGISNTTFFYHKYEQKFGHSPKNDREKNQFI